jgi:hypothetical protein
MVQITKETVLKGTTHRVEVPASELGDENAVLVIRPLSGNEMMQVTKVLLGNMTRKDLENTKLYDMTLNEHKGKITALAIAASVNGQKYTADDIDKLPHGVIERAYESLSEISGFMSPQKALRKLRLKALEKQVLKNK